jgi:hypothetical protein
MRSQEIATRSLHWLFYLTAIEQNATDERRLPAHAAVSKATVATLRSDAPRAIWHSTYHASVTSTVTSTDALSIAAESLQAKILQRLDHGPQVIHRRVVAGLHRQPDVAVPHEELAEAGRNAGKAEHTSHILHRFHGFQDILPQLTQILPAHSCPQHGHSPTAWKSSKAINF